MALSDLTPDTQDALELLFDFSESQLGISPTVVSTLRTCATQNALFAQGRTAPGPIVTNARGCISWHVLGRAVDISLGPGATRQDFTILGEFWEQLGGFWGGRIEGLDDLGHFEWHPGHVIERVCPNPDDCENAVQRSRALNLPPPGFSGGSQLLTAGVVAALVFGAWWLYTNQASLRTATSR